ncbi:TRAP transporter large permease subunit [Vibrio chagasii]|nr:TRAP transporter large permease subunit [Vibrio chagasii]
MPVIKWLESTQLTLALLFVINCSIGLITPPVGTVLNVVCGVARVPMSTAVKGVLPHCRTWPTHTVCHLPYIITVNVVCHWLILDGENNNETPIKMTLLRFNHRDELTRFAATTLKLAHAAPV